MTQQPKEKSGVTAVWRCTMTPAKLTTTAEVLAWAEDAAGCRSGGYFPEDTATALYIAECVRLRQAFEAAESATCDCSPSTGCPEDCEVCNWESYPNSIKYMLRAALEEVK